jgi:hypothetical protein
VAVAAGQVPEVLLLLQEMLLTAAASTAAAVAAAAGNSQWRVLCIHSSLQQCWLL